MNLNELIAWFIMMFPLVYSPGPNNIICAISGAAVGFRKTLSFIIGVNISIILYAVLIGYGMGELFSTFPAVAKIIKYGGALYLFYLAFKFFRSAHSNTAKKDFTPLGVKDGFLINTLNAKTVTALIMMYSQFITPNDNLSIKVPLLTLLSFILSIGAHFLWTLSGSALTLFLESEKNRKYQAWVFSIMLLGVGIWLLFR